MNLENIRVKNSIRNIYWGVLSGIVSVVVPFVCRAIILHLLGKTYLGVGTLFTSILQFLNLLEMGVGVAITYAMYKPIADNDEGFLCCILNYIKRLYYKIGIIMTLIGVIIMPFVPCLTHGQAPKDINIYILYFIYLLNSTISFYVAGYRECLLIAHQRRDVVVKWTTCVEMFVQLIQVVVLFSFRNFYIYAIVPVLGTLLRNYICLYATRKMYPNIHPKGEISECFKLEIKRKITGLFGAKMGSVVLHFSDAIIISSILGLDISGMYGNYYSVLYAICGFVATLFASMTASIGDKLISDSLETNYKLFVHISFANNWIVGWCSIAFVCLIESIVKMFFGDDMLFGTGFSILMGLYLYIYLVQKAVLTYKDAAGIWRADRYRPIVVMITNIVSNIVLIQYLGVYGVVASTIFSLLISLPWANGTLFSELFHRSSNRNILLIVINGGITITIGSLTYFLCTFTHNDVAGFIIKIFVCILVPNILYAVIYSKTESLKFWRKFAVSFFKNR